MQTYVVKFKSFKPVIDSNPFKKIKKIINLANVINVQTYVVNLKSFKSVIEP